MEAGRLAAGFMLGFACGSIPFGWLAGRLRGVDLRRHGSGNIGFANVQRNLGWLLAIPVLLLDMTKGAVPVVLSSKLGFSVPSAGFGAVCGHVFTPWLAFRGGKGVATAIGVGAVLFPRALLAAMVIYLAVLVAGGFISLASISLALFLPLLVALFYPRHPALVGCAVSLSLLILLRHLANINRLTSGTEPRLGVWVRLFRRRP